MIYCTPLLEHLLVKSVVDDIVGVVTFTSVDVESVKL